MLRSLMTAVTGVRSHQTMLDVVGNNVANVNTTGFKRSTTVFQDLLYQSSRGATGPGDNRGGINPLQVGLGVSVAGVEMVQTAGPLQYTGNRTDVAIQGDGYFVLADGMNKFYSRAGNFTLDGDGTLVHVGTGFRVEGYEMAQDPSNPMNYVADASLGDITIKIGSKLEAKETNTVGFRCNLDSRVDTYLPFGITNMDAAVTLVNNDTTAGTITPYNCTVVNTGTTGDGVIGTTGTTRFTSYTINTVNDDGSVSPRYSFGLKITGIKDGKPTLGLIDSAGADLTDTSRVITDTTDYVDYDPESGTLAIKDQSGVTKWTASLFTDYAFNSFTLEDKTETPTKTYDVLAEFDETAIENGRMPGALWAYERGSSAVPVKVAIEIPVNSDGTFNINANGQNLDDFITAGTLPGIYGTAGTVRVNPAGVDAEGLGGGLGLEFEATDGNKMNVVSTITQDMTATHSTKADIYDCQGNAHTLEVVYKKIGNNLWRWEAFFPEEPDLLPDPNYGEIAFEPCGKFKEPSNVQINVPYSVLGSKDAKVTLDFSGESFGYTQEDIGGITQYGSETTTKPYYQDGYAMGVLNDFSTGIDGTISGKYTNGKTIPLYKLALATFENAAGLERAGNTVFAESANSGIAQIGAPLENGAGQTVGGNLEMSNVDITEEFTRLILAQRGFQANARIVTVSDSILEEAVNLKR